MPQFNRSLGTALLIHRRFIHPTSQCCFAYYALRYSDHIEWIDIWVLPIYYIKHQWFTRISNKLPLYQLRRLNCAWASNYSHIISISIYLFIFLINNQLLCIDVHIYHIIGKKYVTSHLPMCRCVINSIIQPATCR